MDTRPYLLLANDDGYDALGLSFLIEVLREDYDLLVVAPDGPRSGFSTAFTVMSPIAMRSVREEEGLSVYACSGTPADCVKVALNRYTRRRPDLVVSGVNHGDNSSVNAHYSGTMGVAFEASLQGIPAIAFSICDYSPKANFEPLRPYVKDMVSRVLREGMPPLTCLNVNFPLRSTFEGVKVCRMGNCRWEKEIEDCPSPRHDATFYWMAGHLANLEPEAEDTDRWALDHGYIAITPTTLDNTDYRYREILLNSW